MSNTKTKNITHKPLFIIMKRELKAYFTSPVAYIVTCLFLILSGLVFFSFFFLQNRADLREFFSWLPIFFSFFVPALTMKLFAEEKRVGSIETLMTLPVTEVDVVMGKYFASLIGTVAMLAPTLLYLITLEIFGNPDYGPIAGGYVAAIFLGAAFTAIGCFASSITNNQIIAFFTGFIICIALTMIDTFSVVMPGPVLSFVSFISARSHFSSISKGILDTRDLIYFISVAALFIAMTIHTQKKAKN